MSGPTTSTIVASHNVLFSLPPAQARSALADVLALEPDLVGLQEWQPTRVGLLREVGTVGPVGPVVGRLPRLGPRPGPAGSGGWTWSQPLLGGCAVGARTDRFELLGVRGRWLDVPGRAERRDRPLGLEPPRVATVATYRDRRDGRVVSLVDYHLSPGVEARGTYRADRPVLVARHRREVSRLQETVAGLMAAGHVVHAVGDANVHDLRIPGLTSAWEGREDAPGTLGPRRRIDDVHGPGRAMSVTTLATTSDHRAVVAER